MKAIRERVDGINFDSRLEAQAYRLLVAVYGKQRVYCQYPIALIGKQEYFTPNITHRIDFAVFDEEIKNVVLLIEVKGTLCDSFLGKAEYVRTLEILRLRYPELMECYQVWVGDGVKGFKYGCPVSIPFAHKFPLNTTQVRIAGDLSLGKSVNSNVKAP